MKSSYKAAYSAGAVALVLAGAAHSAPPPDRTFFDKWTVSNGAISAPSTLCAATYDCSAAALTSAGFYMRMITDTSLGKSYFQTIVTEPDATATAVDSLTFSDENFVSYHNDSGIIDKQRINQDQLLTATLTSTPHTVEFRNGSVIGTGWGKDFVELTQSIADPIADGGDGFQVDFLYKQVGYSNGTSILPHGKGMKITNVVPISHVTGPTVIKDRQDFVLVETQGDFTKGTVTSASLPNTNGSNGGALTWAGDTTAGPGGDGDRVQALWIGQDISVTAGQQFGFGAYTNFTTTTRIDSFTLADTWGNASTGVPGADLNWNTTYWGDLKTEGTITSTFPNVP
jgi:hypothetical protein